MQFNILSLWLIFASVLQMAVADYSGTLPNGVNRVLCGLQIAAPTNAGKQIHAWKAITAWGDLYTNSVNIFQFDNGRNGTYVEIGRSTGGTMFLISFQQPNYFVPGIAVKTLFMAGWQGCYMGGTLDPTEQEKWQSICPTGMSANSFVFLDEAVYVTCLIW